MFGTYRIILNNKCKIVVLLKIFGLWVPIKRDVRLIKEKSEFWLKLFSAKIYFLDAYIEYVSNEIINRKQREAILVEIRKGKIVYGNYENSKT